MRLVLDTNVVVSAMLWQGAPSRLLEVAERGAIKLFTCHELIAELLRVLNRPKFTNRLSTIASNPQILTQLYRSASSHIDLPTAIPRISRNPNDDVVLACAVEAAADAIVSGDGDLLVLGHHQGILILSVSQILKQLIP